jgi:hypothetical protein
MITNDTIPPAAIRALGDVEWNADERAFELIPE